MAPQGHVPARPPAARTPLRLLSRVLISALKYVCFSLQSFMRRLVVHRRAPVPTGSLADMVKDDWPLNSLHRLGALPVPLDPSDCSRTK